MPFNKRFYSIVVLTFCSVLLMAQNGGPLLSHYRESTEIENQSWAICQDENNVMLFANIRGLLTFDGQVWNTVRIPVTPYALKYCRKEKRVYIGGDNDFGYLKHDDKGFYRFVSMRSDSSSTGIISRIIFTETSVWFYGERSIMRYNIATGKPELRLDQKQNKPFTGMFITPENVFINVYNEGLYRLESDTLFPIVTGYMLEKNEVLFGLPYDSKMVLLGLGDGSLSLFDGIKFYPYQVKDEGYLKANSLSDGIVASDSLYAFSTLDGGAMIVERKSGRVKYTVNYANGLPDDEIFAIGSDHNNGLWLSHQYGLTRVELVLPVANLGLYPGLKGNLINPVWYNNELFVASSEGVFYLSEVRNYSETQVLVKKEQPEEIVQDTKPSVPEQQVAETGKTRKSIFSRIFGKKYTPETIAQPAEPKQETAPQKIIRATPVYIKKTVSRLKSVDYVYRKIEGLNDKCRQLVPTPFGILASTSRGVYSITGHTAKLVASERNITFISQPSEDGKYYVSCGDGYFRLTPGTSGWSVDIPDRSFSQPLYSIVYAGSNTVWAAGDNIAVKITTGDKPEYRIYNLKTDYPQRCRVSFANDTVFVYNESGVYYIEGNSDTPAKYQRFSAPEGQRMEYLVSQGGSFWVKKDGSWICVGNRTNISFSDMAILKVFDSIISIYSDEKDIWVITAENQLYRIERNKIVTLKPALDLFIRSIQNEKGLYFSISHIEFDRGDNNIYFDVVAPGYQKRNSVQYQYIVDRMMDDWSKWSSRSTINLMLPHGTYNMRVRAKDIWGDVSEPKQVTFTIKTPFTQTTFFFVILLFAGLLAVILIVWFREKHLKHEKHILEEKVKERTAEIEAQKQEITSSIEYAGRIQVAMLPIDDIFKNNFSDHFIIFKPRDIVSGDFYWVGEDANHIFFTVADCTGHGVPGAFMSTLGISTLNEIITNKTDLHANTVLNLLRTKIKTSLHQTGKEGEAADGMDIAFCILHKNRMILEYSGAYNPLFINQGGEIKEYKADRMPIGIYVGEKDSFTNFEINVRKGDTLYLFSDGISDQFGGPDGSKFKKATLRKILATLYEKPMAEQGKIVEAEFEKWKGKGEQIDDVTILGLKI